MSNPSYTVPCRFGCGCYLTAGSIPELQNKIDQHNNQHTEKQKVNNS